MALSKMSRGLFLLAFVFLSPWLLGQNPQLQLQTNKRFPTLIFSSLRWNANPSYYSIAINSSGTATYQSAPEGIDESGVARGFAAFEACAFPFDELPVFEADTP